MAGAQFVLGDMHATGRGADPDPREAAKWYLLAADGGSAEAHHALAAILDRGVLGRPDHGAAMRQEAAAAEAGLPIALYGMGAAAERPGMDADAAAEAMKWYLLAEAGGIGQASSGFARLAAQYGPAVVGDARRRVAEWQRGHPAPAWG